MQKGFSKICFTECFFRKGEKYSYNNLSLNNIKTRVYFNPAVE